MSDPCPNCPAPAGTCARACAPWVCASVASADAFQRRRGVGRALNGCPTESDPPTVVVIPPGESPPAVIASPCPPAPPVVTYRARSMANVRSELVVTNALYCRTCATGCQQAKCLSGMGVDEWNNAPLLHCVKCVMGG